VLKKRQKDFSLNFLFNKNCESATAHFLNICGTDSHRDAFTTTFARTASDLRAFTGGVDVPLRIGKDLFPPWAVQQRLQDDVHVFRGVDGRSVRAPDVPEGQGVVGHRDGNGRGARRRGVLEPRSLRPSDGAVRLRRGLHGQGVPAHEVPE
jgi:hypothetical protein